jgi:hypothetical protein
LVGPAGGPRPSGSVPCKSMSCFRYSGRPILGECPLLAYVTEEDRSIQKIRHRLRSFRRYIQRSRTGRLPALATWFATFHLSNNRVQYSLLRTGVRLVRPDWAPSASTLPARLGRSRLQESVVGQIGSPGYGLSHTRSGLWNVGKHVCRPLEWSVVLPRSGEGHDKAQGLRPDWGDSFRFI